MRSVIRMNDKERVRWGRSMEDLYKSIPRKCLQKLELLLKKYEPNGENYDIPDDEIREIYPSGVSDDIELENSFFAIYCDEINKLELDEVSRLAAFELGKVFKERFSRKHKEIL